MYVSTAYSNAHLKRYSTVKEQLYPLREQDGREVDHAAIVDRLLAMPVNEAQKEVKTVCSMSSPVTVSLSSNYNHKQLIAATLDHIRLCTIKTKGQAAAKHFCFPLSCASPCFCAATNEQFSAVKQNKMR